MNVYYIFLDRDRDLHLDRALALGPGAALDYLLTIGLQSSLIIEHFHRDKEVRAQIGDFTAYFAEVAKKAFSISPELAAGLAALTVPAESAPQADWAAFNGQVRQLMLEHRDLGHEWDLSAEQTNALAAYLEGSRFLLECLEVAYVDDREAIKNSLLLPPGEWEF